MRTWILGGVAVSALLLAAGCKIETTDNDGLGGSGSGGTASGGVTATGGTSSSGGKTSTSGGADGSGGSNPTGAAGDSGGAGEAGAGGGPGGDLGFTPSNVPTSAVGSAVNTDLILGGASCSTTVTINTDTGDIRGCDLKAGTDYTFASVEQSDGSKIGVFIANKIRIEQTITAVIDGQAPLVLFARDTLQVVGKLQASASLSKAVAGGFQGVVNVSNTPGNGPGGGGGGKAGGGGSYCGKGGKSPANTNGGGIPYSTPEIIPLVGGSSGGSASIWDSGGGGGAVQLVAGTSIQISTTGVINVGGGGGGQGSNGGGSGGAILLEAPIVTIAGILAANGGGGGSGSGTARGQNGLPSGQAALGGGTDGKGGDGSSALSIDGLPGTVTGSYEGGGGGGAGVIRINTATGAANITGTLSPGLTSTCATQGVLK
ncbi:MAG: hypothetical protein ACOY0T_37920 [Myxococcota bacterium]